MAKLYIKKQAKSRERPCLGTKDKETKMHITQKLLVGFLPNLHQQMRRVLVHLFVHEVIVVQTHNYHPKTLFEMWITCLNRVSANSEKGRGSEWAVRVGQRLQSRFEQSGAVRELNLVQIVEEVLTIRVGLPSI